MNENSPEPISCFYASSNETGLLENNPETFPMIWGNEFNKDCRRWQRGGGNRQRQTI